MPRSKIGPILEKEFNIKKLGWAEYSTEEYKKW